ADLGDGLSRTDADRPNEARGALPACAARILEPAQHELEVPRVAMGPEATRYAVRTAMLPHAHASVSSGTSRRAHHEGAGPDRTAGPRSTRARGATRPPQRSHATRPFGSRPNSARRLAWSGGSRATRRSGA